QKIAADGAFAAAMLAEFRAPLERFGPWFYRRLHWETGVVGQLLYLEAEASGIRATGIGCFFDDATHLAFRLAGDQFQVLYHFTLGGAVEDPRLQTSPPYDDRSTGGWSRGCSLGIALSTLPGGAHFFKLERQRVSGIEEVMKRARAL